MLHKTEYCEERYSNRTMVPIRTGKLEVYGRPWKREFRLVWENSQNLREKSAEKMTV